MTSTDIPSYRVQGTHYECAHAIGVLCRERIQNRIAESLSSMAPLFAFVRTEAGLQSHRGFVEVIRSMFPWYWDEIRGLADGSETSLEHLLVLNFKNETQTALRLSEQEKADEEPTGVENGGGGCTTVLINRQDTHTLSLLHNEDSGAALYMTGYLVEANIKSSPYDEGARHSPNEKFISYCYPGNIPGNTFGANMHGFVCALNGLFLNYVGHNRLPRQIVNRALLSVRNEQELDQFVLAVPSAYGFSINGGFFCEHEDNQRYLFNYELGPNINSDNNITTKNFVSKCLILNGEQYKKYQKTNNSSSVALNFLVYYNQYERLTAVIDEQKPSEWTRARVHRGLELGEIHTVEDAVRLLGDQANKAFPIFCAPGKTDLNLATLCTTHFNFHTLQLVIYHHNPREQSAPTLVYDLAELWKHESGNDN